VRPINERSAIQISFLFFIAPLYRDRRGAYSNRLLIVATRALLAVTFGLRIAAAGVNFHFHLSAPSVCVFLASPPSDGRVEFNSMTIRQAET